MASPVVPYHRFFSRRSYRSGFVPVLLARIGVLFRLGRVRDNLTQREYLYIEGPFSYRACGSTIPVLG